MSLAGPNDGSSIAARSAAVTHLGLVRGKNEDAYVRDDGRGVWAVVDGMGGHALGELASEVVVSHVGSIRTDWSTPGALTEEVISRLENANSELRSAAMERGVGTIGATVACLVIFDRSALVTWCGDCRVYRLRDDRPIRQITRDHTLVQQLIDEARLRPEEAESHPESHVLTRAIGASDRLELDFQQLDLRQGDRFILCSDGLTRHVSESRIQALSDAAAKPEEICARLLAAALEAGAPDNVTISVVDFG